MNYEFKYNIGQEVLALSYGDLEYHKGWVCELKINRGEFVSYFISFEDKDVVPHWIAEECVHLPDYKEE